MIKEKFGCISSVQLHADMAAKLSEITQQLDTKLRQVFTAMKLQEIFMIKLFEAKLFIKLKALIEVINVPAQIIWQDRYKEENSIYFNAPLTNLLRFDSFSFLKMWAKYPFVEYSLQQIYSP
jgi:hypothetical protein